MITYLGSWLFLSGVLDKGVKKDLEFEKFHRRFLSYGLGCNVTYFIVKSICNVFSMGSHLTYEIMSRQGVDSIP